MSIQVRQIDGICSSFDIGLRLVAQRMDHYRRNVAATEKATLTIRDVYCS